MPLSSGIMFLMYDTRWLFLYIRTTLRHRTGAKRRPHQRRASAAKRIIRAEIPKDTGPIYLRAGFFRATAARNGLDDLNLFAVLADDQVPDVNGAVYAGVGAL